MKRGVTFARVTISPKIKKKLKIKGYRPKVRVKGKKRNKKQTTNQGLGAPVIVTGKNI